MVMKMTRVMRRMSRRRPRTLICYIFSGGPAPDPLAAGDANSDGSVDISDPVFLISCIFSGGAAPSFGCD